MMLGSTPYLLVDVEYAFPASTLFCLHVAQFTCSGVAVLIGCGLGLCQQEVRR